MQTTVRISTMKGYKYKCSWLFPSRLRSSPNICLGFPYYFCIYYDDGCDVDLVLFLTISYYYYLQYEYHLFGRARHRAATEAPASFHAWGSFGFQGFCPRKPKPLSRDLRSQPPSIDPREEKATAGTPGPPGAAWGELALFREFGAH